MSGDTAEKTHSVGPRYVNPCAQCGERLLAPEWSEHVNERCVRHVWACESCGYQFETMVFLELR